MNLRRHQEWLTFEGPEGDAYRAAFEEAKSIATDALLAQAWKLAVEGVDRPMVSAGKVVAYERVYEPKLLAILLRAHLPEPFGDARERKPADVNVADLLKEARARVEAHRAEREAAERAEAERRIQARVEAALSGAGDPTRPAPRALAATVEEGTDEEEAAAAPADRVEA